jgi:excinuclease ABC subunit A
VTEPSTGSSTSGLGGGEIVAAGPPEEIVQEKRSYTGAFLKPVLARGGREEEAG